jgi:uncharacterized protein YoxC
MKTLRTIATVLIAAVLVLGPTVAFAATTLTVATGASTYTGQATIQVTGTVTPAPSSSASAVVVTTKGPQGVVDTGTAPVATGTGAFSYTFVAGGSAMWVQGTYTVNATWGFAGDTAKNTATFTYNPGITTPGGGGGPSAISVQVTASSPTAPGAQESVAILTSFASNGSLAAATFQTVHFHTPAGSLVTLCSSSPPATGCTGTFATVHKGFYIINFTAPTATGGYFVHAWTSGPKDASTSGQGQGLGQFTVMNATATSGGGGSSAQLTNIQNTLNSIQTSVNTLTTGFNSLSSGLQTLTTAVNGIPSTLSSIQSSVNSISQGVSGITTTLGSVQTGLSAITGISGQLTTLNNAINNNQTYVLVVAALAAITLVLELAILVRKLS